MSTATPHKFLALQRETPSFVSKTTANGVTSVLDMPMPSALRDHKLSSGELSSIYSTPADRTVRNAASLGRPIASRPVAAGDLSVNTISNVRSIYANDSSLEAMTSPRSDRQRSHQLSGSLPTPGERLDVYDGKTVYESLIERGKLSSRNKEIAKVDHIREELSRCRSVPKVSNKAHQIERSEAVWLRLNRLHEEQEIRHENTVALLKKKEDEALKDLFKPTLSAGGNRAISGTATQPEKWSEKTKQRIEELRREKLIKDIESVYGSPEINHKSEQLAMKMREREGMEGLTHIEAMIERDRLLALSRYEQHELAMLEYASATPQITAFAANIDRGGEDIVDRLHREGLEAAKRKKDMEERQYAPRNVSRSGTRAHSAGLLGNYQRKKKLISEADISIDNLPVTQHFYEQKARNDERIRINFEKDQQVPSYKPSINPVSQAIAARLPNTTKDRLLTSPTTMSPNASSRGNITRQGLNQSTPESAGGSHNTNTDEGVTEREITLFERLKITEARKNMRMEAAKKAVEQRRMEECTFTPMTTTSYYPPSLPQNRGGPKDSHYTEGSVISNGSDSNVFDRQMSWVRQRDERIQQRREQHKDDDIKGCTFQPETSPSSFGLMSPSQVPSFAAHFVSQKVGDSLKNLLSPASTINSYCEDDQSTPHGNNGS